MVPCFKKTFTVKEVQLYSPQQLLIQDQWSVLMHDLQAIYDMCVSIVI